MTSSKHARRSKLRVDDILMIHGYWSAGVRREGFDKCLNGQEYIGKSKPHSDEETSGKVYDCAVAISNNICQAIHAVVSANNDYSMVPIEKKIPRGKAWRTLIQPNQVADRWTV